MTEYDYSPEAYDRFMAQQDRIGRWVDKTQNHSHEFISPFEFTRSEADREQSAPPSPFDRQTPPLPEPYHAPFSPPAQGPAITYTAFGQPYAVMPQNAGATYFAPVPGATYLPPTQYASMNRSRSHEGHSRSLDSTHKQHGQKRSQSRGHHARSPTYIIQPPAGPSSYPSFASQPVVSPPIGHGSVFYYPAASQPQSRVTSPGVSVQNVYTYQGRSYSVQSPPGSVYSMQSPPASLYGPQSPPASYGAQSPQGTYVAPQPSQQQQQGQPYPVWYAPQQMQQMPTPPQYLVIPKTKSSKRSKSKQSAQRVIYV